MTDKPKRKIYQRKRLWLLGVYLLLLIISDIYRLYPTKYPFPTDKNSVTVRAVSNESLTDTSVRIAYKEFLPVTETDSTPIIMIHGSPGDSGSLTKLAKMLSQNRRVIVPDMPGFGHSTADIPDYSFRAHARYVLELADELKIRRFDALGFSMGGGVVLNLYDIAPEKVRSIEMVSAIGVQEYELLGDYHLNHILHGLQLWGFRILRDATPHFGIIGETTITYSRNFYDSDQRHLREILQSIDIPVQIIHGTEDPLVPIEAAREHARIITQSEFHELGDESHFMVFMHPDQVSPMVENFLGKVKNQMAQTRQNADAARIVESNKPFQLNISAAKGVAAFVFFCLLVLCTLVSEDLTCIAAGLLAANGRISLFLAIIACFFGIYLGDLLLYFVGKWFGTKALNHAPLRWMISENSVKRAAEWFEKRGAIAILLSRFTPSFRLPTYFSAGMFGMNFLKFAFFSFIAVAIWTPILVFLAYWLGAGVIESAFMNGQNILWKLILTFFIGYFLIKFLLKLTTWKGRRLALGKWRRLTHWEFWSMKVFYPPVLAYIAWLVVKNKSLTVFTCANPAIKASGFVGESKAEILKGLAKSPENDKYLLKFALIAENLSEIEKLELAKHFIQHNNLDFPIALKPNVSERGIGAFIVKNNAELEKHLIHAKEDLILQEFARGDEFSVFYYRFPNSQKGKIFAITEKHFPVVVGDGVSTLETLILRDERAICLTKSYFKVNENSLEKVLEKGAKFQLIDIGSHSRGTIFLDGNYLKTDALEANFDEICGRYKGFYFGRSDVRTPLIEDFKRGENFKIIEFNGVTSEATNIYDPKNSLVSAYKTLFEQWRIAFEIGDQNFKNGAPKTTLRELIKLVLVNVYGISSIESGKKIKKPENNLKPQLDTD